MRRPAPVLLIAICALLYRGGLVAAQPDAPQSTPDKVIPKVVPKVVPKVKATSKAKVVPKPTPDSLQDEFKKLFMAASDSKPFAQTALRIANGIDAFVKDAAANGLSGGVILENARNRAIEATKTTSLPGQWRLQIGKVERRIKTESPALDAAEVTAILGGPVKAALLEIGLGANTQTSALTESIETQITSAFANVDDEKKRQFADTLASRFRELDRNSSDFKDVQTTKSALETAVNAIIDGLKLDATGSSALKDATGKILGQLKAVASSKDDFLEQIQQNVIPVITKFGTPPDGGALGVTEYVIKEGKRLKNYLLNDVIRDQTALSLAATYDKASRDVMTTEKSTTEFNKDVIEQINKVLEPANERAKLADVPDAQMPWRALRTSIGAQLVRLNREGKFSFRSRSDWHKVYHELAEGFRKLVEAVESDSKTSLGAGNRGGGASSSSSDSNLLGTFSGLPGSAYELEAKLELRRKAYRIHRKMVQEEFKYRQELARETSKERAKRAEKKFEEAAKEYRRQLRDLLDD